MGISDKIKSKMLVIGGISWIIFVLKFDAIIGKPQGFGIHAVFAIAAGIISIVNGLRISRRK